MVVSAIRGALSAELASAMRRRDSAVVSAVRNALSAVANAEASEPDEPLPAAVPVSQHFAGATPGLGATEVARIELSDEQVLELVAHERADLLAHAERLTRLCRRDEADSARRAAGVLAAAMSRAMPATPGTDSTGGGADGTDS